MSSSSKLSRDRLLYPELSNSSKSEDTSGRPQSPVLFRPYMMVDHVEGLDLRKIMFLSPVADVQTSRQTRAMSAHLWDRFWTMVAHAFRRAPFFMRLMTMLLMPVPLLTIGILFAHPPGPVETDLEMSSGIHLPCHASGHSEDNTDLIGEIGARPTAVDWKNERTPAHAGNFSSDFKTVGR